MPVSAVSASPYVDQWQNADATAYSVFPKKEANDFPGMKKKDDSSEPKGTGKKQLTPEQEKEVEKLKKRDAEVRAHEQAHVAAGGAYIKGGVSYSYQKGPDGQMYAVGGEVSIDTSPVRNNPQATIVKMETVKAAALAPADPSGADRAVAAAAQQEESKAIQEETQQKTTSSYSSNGQKTANVNPMPMLINMVA